MHDNDRGRLVIRHRFCRLMKIISQWHRRDEPSCEEPHRRGGRFDRGASTGKPYGNCGCRPEDNHLGLFLSLCYPPSVSSSADDSGIYCIPVVRTKGRRLDCAPFVFISEIRQQLCVKYFSFETEIWHRPYTSFRFFLCKSGKVLKESCNVDLISELL